MYNQTIDYINSFINFEKIPQYSYASSFNLERMHAFLEKLGNPHLELNVIHVAGSKGKGSTCSICATILKEAGFLVGIYTSPHLIDIRERIKVLSVKCEVLSKSKEIIEKEEFVDLVEKIRPVAEEFRDHKELGKLSFFEFLTAMAFLYFKEKKVDFAILETGLGGRLDATNVVDPLICGITSISLEHTDKLGDSLELIAKEKAGIIKDWRWEIGDGRLVVSASQQDEVRDVIRNVCVKRKAKLYEVGRDVKYSITSSDEFGQVFNIEGPGFSYDNLQLNLLGEHQVENAALSIAMLNKLNINEEAVRRGLKNVSWPGRLQVVQKNPYLILDGAQNIASVKAVLSSIKSIFSYKNLILVFGISSDKDIEGLSKELDKFSNIVILTKSKNERAQDPESLKTYFPASETKVSGSVERALNRALEISSKDDLVLVTGSLYVVGEALALNKVKIYKRTDKNQNM